MKSGVNSPKRSLYLRRVGTERALRHFFKVKELLPNGPLAFSSLNQVFVAGQFWIA